MKKVAIALLAAGLIVLAMLFLIAQPVRTARPRSTSPAVDPERLRQHVTRLVGFAPRDFSHVGNLEQAAAYIAKEFAAAGARVSEQPFRAESREYRNVIARFGPEAGEVFVVGAHYDAVMGTPGADDNASGVAGLLELAHLLGKAELKNPAELVAYTLEEPPFFRGPEMGSAVHARALKQSGASVRGMVSLEMIGYYSAEEVSQRYPVPGLEKVYGSRGDFIVLAGRLADVGLLRRIKTVMSAAASLPVHSINAPVTGVDFSDHASYWVHGYRAVMVTDTAFYRNPHYHERSDTPETLDYQRMAQVVQQVHAAVLELSR